MMTMSAPAVAPRSNTRLTGGRKWLARVVWLIVAIPIIVLQLVGAKPYHEMLQTVCTGAVEPCASEQLTVESVAGLVAAGMSLEGYANALWLTTMFSVIIWLVVGVILFLLRSDDWMAILASLFLIVFGGVTFVTGSLEYMGLVYPQLSLLVNAWNILGEFLITAFFLLFPNGRMVPRRLWWLLIYRPLFASAEFLSSLTLSNLVYILLFATPIVLIILAQVYRYRRVSTAAERQQTRWVLFGFLVGISTFLVVFATALVTGSWEEDFTRTGLLFGLLIQLAMLAIPISIGIAMLRSKLWDIDVVIRKTTVYAILTGALLLVYFGTIVVLQRLLSPITGDSQAAVVLSTLLIAALFLPLRRRVQDAIDRRFFRRKYDAEQVLAQFAATVRDETDLDALTTELVRVIQETMQPEFVSVWLRPVRVEEGATAVPRLSGNLPGGATIENYRRDLDENYGPSVGAD
jgi:hypothetical protein